MENGMPLKKDCGETMKKIFISYSRKDKEWKDRLVKHLKVLELEGYYEVWEDSQNIVGDDWQGKLEDALNEANVAILMVSVDFLLSDFIRRHELSPIMERRKQGDLWVVPVLVKDCGWKDIEWLAKIQLYPQDGIPLVSLSQNESESRLTALARLIKDIVAVSPGEFEPKADRSETKDGKRSQTKLLTSLPVRNIKLIDREEVLNALKQRLKMQDLLILVTGIGGIGKTEVCKRFFLEYYKEYSYAGWVDCVGSFKHSLISAFDFSAGVVNVTEDETSDVKFKAIISFFMRLDQEALLVLDNIEMPDDQDIKELKQLPENIKIIANSRSQMEGVDLFNLDNLSEKGCKELFYRHYDMEEDDDGVVEVMKTCGYHTLTVELLARTARNAGIKIKDLFTLLHKEGFNLNNAIGDKVHTFWGEIKEDKRFFDHLLTIFSLSHLVDKEKEVLLNLAMLPATFISYRDIANWLDLKDNTILNLLVTKGWLQRSEGKIHMHQVIQAVVRNRLKPHAWKCAKLIDSLACKLEIKPNENPLDRKTYAIYAASILHYIDDEVEDVATLANNLSAIYQDLGDLGRALDFQLKALTIRKKILNPNHSDLAQSYNNISLIYQNLGDIERSLEFQLKALTIREKFLNPKHSDLAQSYNNISTIYKQQGDLERALDFQMMALDIREKVLDKNHPDLAQSYNNVSLIYKDKGDLTTALNYLMKTLKIEEQRLGHNHPSLASTYYNLSRVYNDLKNYQKAFCFAQKAAFIDKHNFPKGHPNLDLSLRNLEEITTKLGDDRLKFFKKIFKKK
jgi:tetratricopeptide (TPR) repeat protein